MTLTQPFLHPCFLYWTDGPDTHGEDSLHIASWRRSLTLKGKGFRAFQESVLPLLNGKNTVSQICSGAADQFEENAVLNALAILENQGVLIEGNNLQPHWTSTGMTPQQGWLTENSQDRAGGQARLEASHVVLFGAGGHGAVAARALTAAGLGHLTLVDPAPVSETDCYFSGLYTPADVGMSRAEILQSRLAGPGKTTRITAVSQRPADLAALHQMITPASLVLCCLDSGELALASLLNIACQAQRKPWLSSQIEGNDIVIGPGFFHRAGGPCYLCWRMRDLASAANMPSRSALEQYLARAQGDLSPRREALAMFADVAGGMIAAEAFTALTATSLPNLDGRFLTLTVPGLTQEKHVVLRHPDCPVCNSTAERDE